MTGVARVALGVFLAVAATLGAGVVYVMTTGLTTRAAPGAIETTMARAVRRLAIPRAARRMVNPVASTPEHLADGLAHFADHCASCHANDGGGATDLGRGLFPPAPDMRRPATQELTDGELFYIIENGVRFTGMPGWGDGSDSSSEATWRLVLFIRRLPSLSGEDLVRMEGLNPRPPAEIRREIDEERFLAGEATGAPATMTPEYQGAH